MNLNNPMLMLDSYKFSHRQQYPQGTTKVYSNWTPRSSHIEGQNEVVFFGLQYFLQKYMMEDMKVGFFDRPKDEVLKEYDSFLMSHLGPNNIGTEHIAALHDLGYMPLRFCALPEGTKSPLRVAQMTVENTLPEFFWVTNYIETILSTSLWQPCTSATLAYRLRKLLNDAAQTTGGSVDFVAWQGHDFSMRGMAGLWSAQLSGMGHLLSFTGSDTVPAIRAADYYYPGNNGLIGGSVVASEHSVQTVGGIEGEFEVYDRLLDTFPTGILSIVSDTYDLWLVITDILTRLKPKIMSRDGKLVIRPDSGNPCDIICGDPKAPINSPAYKGVVELLWDIFGGTLNKAGFKELDSHIGAIYGDSITYDRAKEITDRLKAKGFASTNIVLGVGSFTYQFNTRDTLGFAMKATWAEINGKGIEMFKDPKTDSGLKKSAKGRLAVVRGVNGLEMIDCCFPEQEKASLLEPVWENGNFLRKQSFADVRATLWGK